MYPSIWVFLLFSLLAPIAYSASDDDLKELQSQKSDDWQLIRNDKLHNIITYWKHEDDKELRSIKAEAIYGDDFDSVAKHQLDPANYKNWFMEMEESYLLKKVSDTEFYYYFKLRAPVNVVPSRDAVIHVQIEPYSAAKGALVIRSTAVPHWLPPKAGLIRIPIFDVVTTIIPVNNQQTKEVTIGYVATGGAVPNWLINYLQRRIPYNNLLGRARDIPNYRNKSCEFKYKE